jgi:Secretion system C-terminal sorting domain
VYPNPIAQGDKVNVTFTLDEAREAKISIVKSNGQVIKNLIQQRIKRGENILSFDSQMLNQGSYYILIETAAGKQALAFVIL